MFRRDRISFCKKNTSIHKSLTFTASNASETAASIELFPNVSCGVYKRDAGTFIEHVHLMCETFS